VRRPGRARDRVDPVPGLAGDHRVEDPEWPGRTPVFELRDLNLDPGLPSQLGHPLVDFHAEHPAAAALELPGYDPGAAANVEDVASGTPGNDRVDQGIRIARPGPVIPVRISPERLRDLPALMRLLF